MAKKLYFSTPDPLLIVIDQFVPIKRPLEEAAAVKV